MAEEAIDGIKQLFYGKIKDIFSNLSTPIKALLIIVLIIIAVLLLSFIFKKIIKRIIKKKKQRLMHNSTIKKS